MNFPSRVNLVFGDQWCLAKLGSGSCPAEAVGAEVLIRRRAWKHAGFRWLITKAEARGRQGYQIRTDHTPHRRLQGGIPVMLGDDGYWFGDRSANHLWFFEAESDDAYHIRSVLSGMYLIVDASGQLTLDNGKPSFLWRHHDATKRYSDFMRRSRALTETESTHLGPCAELWEKWTERSGWHGTSDVELIYWHDGRGGQHPIGKGERWEGLVQLDAKGWMYWTDSEGRRERCRPSVRAARRKANYAMIARDMHRGIAISLLTKSASKKRQLAATSSVATHADAEAGEEDQEDEEDEDEETLEQFDGSPASAFERMVAMNVVPAKDFMSWEALMKNKTELCDEAALFPASMRLVDVFPALYGSESDLFRRFHERRNDQDVNCSPPQPLVSDGAAWGAVSTLTCKVPIPVLGLKPYKEVQRLALCRDGDELTLAVQTVGTVKAGWYGDIVSENLYMFSQSPNGPIRFVALVPTPTGRFASMALDGHKKSLADFVAVAKDILQEFTPRCRMRSPSSRPPKLVKDDLGSPGSDAELVERTLPTLLEHSSRAISVERTEAGRFFLCDRCTYCSTESELVLES